MAIYESGNVCRRSGSRKVRNLFYLNPMTPIIEAYRDIFYYKQAPQMSDFVLGAVMGFLMLIIGWVSFDKMKKHFAEVM